MKPEPNIEIDRVLRKYAQRRSAPDNESVAAVVVAQTTSSAMVHLDADEIAAFAEHAVPPTARARFIAHLADCDACSGLLTSIAASGTAQAAATRVDAGLTGSLFERLLALFAPRNLKFAGPVLAVLCVGVILFVVLRQPENRNLLRPSATTGDAKPAPGESPSVKAKNTSNTPPSAPAEAATTPTMQADSKTATVKEQDSAPESGDRKLDDQPNGKAGPTTLAGEPKVNSVPAPSDKEKQEETQLGQIDQTNVGSPTSGPSQQIRVPVTNAPQTQRREQTADEVAASKDARGGAASQTANVDPNAASNEIRSKTGNDGGRMAKRSGPDANGAGSGVSSPAKPAKQPARSDRDGANDGESNRATETRSFAGRTFARVHDGWVDTRYEGGPTISVKRGSEQYRALVADEPGLGTIAQQLGGQVIVVWKAHSYRIHG